MQSSLDKAPGGNDPPEEEKSEHHGGHFGVYMKNKRRKLRHQFEEEIQRGKNSTTPQIFQDVTAYINGDTEPPFDELKLLLGQNGGHIEYDLSKSTCSHIVAKWLPHTKIEQMLAEKHPLPVVTPKWITDSIKAGKRLPESDYLLEEFRNKGKGVNSIKQYAAKVDSQTHNVGQRHSSEDHMKNRGAVNPNFMNSYFGQSRLHLIGSFRNYIQKIVQKVQRRNKEKSKYHSNPSSERTTGRVIVHLDMDCFFAQISLFTYPHLKTSPVIVAHASNHVRGQSSNSNSFSAAEISAANYFARLYEVSAGMLVGQARELCKELTILPYDFDSIKRCSGNAYRVILSYCLGGRPIGEFLKKLCECQSDTEGEPLSGTAEESRVPLGSLNEIEMEDVDKYDGDEMFRKQLWRHLRNWSRWTGTIREIEATSCDEVYLDISGCEDPVAFVQHLRAAIYVATNCTCSAGIGKNRLLARLATRKSKKAKMDAAKSISKSLHQNEEWTRENALFSPVHPHGVYLIPNESTAIREIMSPLDVSCLPGIGWKNSQLLEDHSIHTVNDVLQSSRETLQKLLGSKQGELVWRCARGDDMDQPLQQMENRKSVGADINWGVRFSTEEEVSSFLERLCDETLGRLKEAAQLDAENEDPDAEQFNDSHYYYRTVTLRVRQRQKGAPEPIKPLGCGRCDHYSKAMSVNLRDDDHSLLKRQVQAAYRSLRVPPKELRGVGLQLSRLKLKEGKHSQENVEQYFRKRTSQGSERRLIREHGDSAADIHPMETVSSYYGNASFSSEVDMEVWNSLPDNVRSELIRSGFSLESSARNSPKRTKDFFVSGPSSSKPNSKYSRGSDSSGGSGRRKRSSKESSAPGGQTTLNDWKHLYRLKKRVIDKDGNEVSADETSRDTSDTGDALFTQKSPSRIPHPPGFPYSYLQPGERVDLESLAALPTKLQVEIVKEMESLQSSGKANTLEGTKRNVDTEIHRDTSKIRPGRNAGNTLDALLEKFSHTDFDHPVSSDDMEAYFRKNSVLDLRDDDAAFNSFIAAVCYVHHRASEGILKWRSVYYIFDVFIKQIAADYRFNVLENCKSFVKRRKDHLLVNNSRDFENFLMSLTKVLHDEICAVTEY
eukprot:gb/GECG01005971.1/.p1 GENE.gb/GECG01005971.1/~~gb/GECG01005971.1/.p1  ORF type:complete len:1116 (+),score=169.62 gb/GECG01005971.1/:1-3348(+)